MQCGCNLCGSCHQRRLYTKAAGKGLVVDGWIVQIHGEHAAVFRDGILRLRAQKILQDIVFPVVHDNEGYRQAFIRGGPQSLRRVKRCTITDERHDAPAPDAERGANWAGMPQPSAPPRRNEYCVADVL